MDSLVSTDWLAAHLNDPDLRLVDVRWYLLDKDKHGYQEYLRGHIPGAIFLDIDRELASPPGGGPGRHPLPTPEKFAGTMSGAGIGADTLVVAYDDRGGVTAGRLWWLLRYFGHANVALLDGGIAQWIVEGRALSIEIPHVACAEFTAQPHPEWVVNAQDILTLQSDPRALILDVRAPERYQGKSEPIDPRAGHVPGAVNAPVAGNQRAANDTRLLSPDELRARFAAFGANDAGRIVAYCGSGINACQAIFALQRAGYDNVLLYEGSWSDWSRDPNLPAAVGDQP